MFNYTMFFDFLLVKYINKINSHIINAQNALCSSVLFEFQSINFVLNSKLLYMKKFAKISLVALICILSIALIFVGGIFVYINTAKSNVKFDKTMLEAQNTTIDIYDMQNNKINEISGKKALVSIEELPSFVADCFVSIEDKDFYKHHGLNYKRIAKAFFNNIKSKSLKEGASTISQQLIKNTHLSSEKTIARKINEMALAKELERNFSKDEIMEMYLNTIYFGSGAYGIENASELYFSKPAKDLKIEESALLAGMIKSPRTYSPISNYQNALNRRNLVLFEMKKDGKITQEKYDELKVIPIEISKTASAGMAKNFYEQATILEAQDVLNMTENQIALTGYKIFTYQVPSDQNALNNAINNLDFYDANEFGNIADGAGIIIDSKTGGICAFDGKSVFDIVNMKRSPGSSIKPILVYAPALEYGKISPSTMILDEPTKFGTYSPQNVGSMYYGWIDATKSVEKSLNIPAIKIMQSTGIENCKRFAEIAGIKFDAEDKSLAIALGGMTHGTSVKQLVNTYVPFANGGKFVEAKFIKKICDKNGRIIYQNKEAPRQIMSEETAFLMTEMLKSGVKKGTSSRLASLPFEVAGKTGTVGIKGTNFNSDVWSVGYTPDKVVGVWLGNSTGEKEYRLEGRNNGGTFCTSIVRDTFEHMDVNKDKFVMPSGIVKCRLDLTKLEKEHLLMLADKETPDRYTTTALFNSKFAPTLVAEKYSKDNLCQIFGKLVDGAPNITFDCIKSAKYKVFRIEEDVQKLMTAIENKNGTQKFVDKDAGFDTLYTYFVEVETADGETARSNSVKIYVEPQKSEIGRILSNW